jgi:RNA ligase (TIGR02306 family)
MSTFAAAVRRLTILPHPDADALAIAQIGGYAAVVGKNQFRTGDLAVYIPETAVLPEGLIAELNLTGKLAGPDKNRVHPLRLRGILSQGFAWRRAPGSRAESSSRLATNGRRPAG